MSLSLEHDTVANSSSNRRTSSISPKTRIDLKIVVMGHGGVGKTSFINRYIQNEFSETVSDTAGQERFTKISNFYCRGAQVAILAYDITDRESFRALENYVSYLGDADKDCMLVIIGTKLDLALREPDLRQVTVEEGQQYARQQHGAFYETSAKDNINVMSVFDRIGFQCFASKLSSEEVLTGSPTIDRENSKIVVATAPNSLSTDRTCCVLQ